jgi:hypothetical protein
MGKYIQILKTCLRLARDHEETKFKHWSFLIIDKQIIAYAKNGRITPPNTLVTSIIQSYILNLGCGSKLEVKGLIL